MSWLMQGAELYTALLLSNFEKRLSVSQAAKRVHQAALQ